MRHWFFSFILAAAWVGSVVTTPASAEDMPWATAQSVLEATYNDAQKGGLKAVGEHAGDIERELAPAKERLSVLGEDGAIHMLADGMAESLFVSMAELTDDKGKKAKVVVEANPYPLMSLLLGSYYNEIGRSEDALRVLTHGLTLSPLDGIILGDHAPHLMADRAVTLARLNRLDEALAAYDLGLKELELEEPMAARFHRGRGFVLIEMQRLDDAEAAYREAVKLDPKDKLAVHQLDYIASIRAGGPAADPTMILKEPASAEE